MGTISEGRSSPDLSPEKKANPVAKFQVSKSGNVIPQSRRRDIEPKLRDQFQKIIQEKIAFTGKVHHTVVVDETKERGVYKLTLDGKTTFVVQLKQTGEASIVQQFVEKRSFLSNLSEFVRTIGALFYRPFVDEKRTGRDFFQATRQDYANLVVSLKKGAYWLEGSTLEAKVKVSSNQNVVSQVRSAIEMGEKVSQALKKSPEKRKEALSELTRELGPQIADGQERIVPVGYVQAGRLEPLFLRFFKEGDRLKVEVYSDLIEGASSTFELTNTKDQVESINNLLLHFFEPLSPKAESDIKLSMLVQGLEQFESAISNKMQDSEIGADVTEAFGREGVQEAASERLTLEKLLKLPNEWMQDRTTGTITKKQSQSSLSGASAFTHWVEHLQKGMSKSEKIDLLVRLTSDWVDFALKEIDFLPREQQLEVLKDCKVQLDRVTGKIIKNIAAGDPTLKDAIPEPIRQKSLKVAKNLEKIEKEMRKERVALASDILNGAQEGALQIPLISKTKAPSRQVSTLTSASPTTSVSLQPIQSHFQALRQALSPQSQQEMACVQHLQALKQKVKPEVYESLTGHITAGRYVEFIKEACVHLTHPELANECRGVELQQISQYLANVLLYPAYFHKGDEKEVLFYNLYVIIVSCRDEYNSAGKHSTFASQERMEAMQNIKLLIDLAGLIPKDKSIEMQMAYLKTAKHKEMLEEVKAQSVSERDVLAEVVQRGSTVDSSALLQKVRDCQKDIQSLRQAANTEKNLERKKELFNLVRENSFELLSCLPSASCGSEPGNPRIYSMMKRDELEVLQDTISEVEEAIWEASLKLQIEKPTPRQELLLFKAQSIQAKIATEKVMRCQTVILESLKTAEKADLDALKLAKCVLFDQASGRFEIQWSRMNAEHAKIIAAYYKTIKGPKPPIEDLILQSRQLVHPQLSSFLFEHAHNELAFSEQDRKELESLATFRYADKAASNDTFNANNYFYKDDDGIHEILASFQNVGKGEVTYPKEVQRLWKSAIYIASQLKPQTTVLDVEHPDPEAPLFASHNGLLLNEGKLSVAFSFPQKQTVQPIITSGNKELAAIFPNGHLDAVTVDDRRMAVFQNIESRQGDFANNEARFWSKSQTLDQWLFCITEEARSRNLEIPADVMKTLVAIRQTDEYSFSRPETITNALAFLVSADLQPYLEFDSVQRLFEELFFDHFLVKSALLSRSELMPQYFQLLNSAISLASVKDRVKALSFLVNLNNRLQEAVSDAMQEIQTHGLTSSYFWNRAPCSRRCDGLVQQMAGAIKERQEKATSLPKSDAFGDEVVRDEYLDVPLFDIMATLQEAKRYLERGSVQTQDVELLLTLKIKKPETNEVEKKACFVELLLLYSRQKEPLTSEQKILCMQAIELFQKEHIPTEKTTLIAHLTEWYKTKVSAKIEDPTILTDFMKLRFGKAFDETKLKGSSWRQDAELPFILYLEKQASQERYVTVDVRTMLVTGSNLLPLTAKSTQEKIPVSLLEKPPLNQALKVTNIQAKVTRSGSRSTEYEWQHDGQQFSLKLVGNAMTITRTIGDKTYQFIPMMIKPKNPAEQLIAEFGLWKNESDGTVALFATGMNRPNEQATFSVQLADDGQSITGMLQQGRYVVSSSNLMGANAIPFVNQSKAIFLADQKIKKIVEVSVPSLNMTLEKDAQGNWTVRREGGKANRIMVSENEKEEGRLFGEAWNEFVIPTMSGQGTTAKRTFLILPYVAYTAPHGSVHARQTATDIAMPIELSIDAHGRQISTPEGFLYLAYQMIMQADGEKNPETARRKYLQAEEYMELALKANPLAKAKQSLSGDQVASIIHSQSQHESGSFPKQATLVAELKLELTLFRIQEKARLSKAVPISAQEQVQHLASMTRISSLYDLCKDPTVKLTADELAQVEEINKALLKELCRNPDAGISSNVTVKLPKKASPELLLALLRGASPPKHMSKSDIHGVIGPLTVENLINDFWSYAEAIHKYKIPPAELLFLFQPCTIGETENPEVRKKIQSLQLEARQFLLAYSALESKMKDPFKGAEEQLNQVKQQASSANDAIEKLALLGQDIQDAAADVQRVVLAIDTTKLAGKSAEQKLHFVDDTLKSCNQALTLLLERSSNKLISCEKLMQALRKERDSLANDEVKLQEFMNRRIDSPFDGKQATVEELFSPESGQMLEALFALVENTKKSHETINANIKEIENYKEFFAKVSPFLEVVTELLEQDEPFIHPVRNLMLPRQEVMEKLLSLDQDAKDPLSLAKALGIQGTLYALKNRRELQNLGGMAQNYMTFLIGLTQCQSIVGDLVSVNARTSLVDQLGLDTAASQEKIEQVLAFLPQEQRQLAVKNLSGMNASERVDYITQLSKLLSQSKDFVATSLQVNKRLEEINKKLVKGIGNIVTERPPIKPLSKSENPELQGHFSDVYLPHFRMRSDTPSDIDRRRAAQDLVKKGQGVIYGFLHDTENQLQSYDPVTRYYAVCLVEINQKGASNALHELLGRLSPTTEGIDALFKTIDKIRSEIIDKEEESGHQALIQQMRETLPDDQSSQYYIDLEKGIQNLKLEPPVSRKPILTSDSVSIVKGKIKEDLAVLDKSEEKTRANILQAVKNAPLSRLPQELQRHRQRGGDEAEVVELALKHYRKGAFQEIASLEKMCSECLQLAVKKKVLFRSLDDSIPKLEKLQKEKDNYSPDTFEKEWASHSDKLLESLDRCQNLTAIGQQIDTLPHLKPHIRKIEYVMYRRGLVLRPKQLETLDEVLKEIKLHPNNPSLLKELRMGAGKTDVLLPILLDVIPELGINPIGMVPKALLTQNFSEMDENTRLLFELSGNLFEFSRKDAPEPITDSTLLRLTEKCLNFVRAAESREYVLTTIEAKASLDDKIEELDRSVQTLHLRHTILSDKIKNAEAEEKKAEEIAPLVKELQTVMNRIVKSEQCLDVLYSTRNIFSDTKSLLIIDEADSVAKANFAVNAEMGKKEPPAPLLQNVVSDLFTIISQSENSDVKELKGLIQRNEQFSVTEKEKIDLFLRAVGKEWLGKHTDKVAIPEDVLLNWMSGSPLPAEFSQIAMPIEYNAIRKALNSSLRASLQLKMGLSCAQDAKQGVVGVPATQTIVNPDTKYSDPLMQLSLTYMLALYQSPSHEFINGSIQEIQDSLRLLQGDMKAEKACKELDRLTLESRQNASFNWAKELAGPDEWKVYLRLKIAQFAAASGLIYLSESQASQPVQRAIFGCNVVGLTGTATRNLQYVISNMEGIAKSGRLVTAEVIYRVAKASKNGLDTPVSFYSQDAKTVLDDFIKIAMPDTLGKYENHAIMNQAGVADSIPTKTIVEEISSKSGRPVITVAPATLNAGTKDEIRTGSKCYCDNGVWKAYTLDVLELLKKDGKTPFYYYDAARCRGTHFDIPLGSKGVAFLSPTVNASDRDQTEYRLRQIGEGHNIEIRISEKQYREIEVKTKRQPCVKDVLKINHNTTSNDEKRENLQALKIAISGCIDSEAAHIKQALYGNARGQKPVRSEGELLSAEGQEEFERELQDKVELSTLVSSRFIQDTSNAKYLEELKGESRAQGDEDAQRHALHLIDKELLICESKIAKVNAKLGTIEHDDSKLRWVFALERLEVAKGKLQTMRQDISNDSSWNEKFAPNLPKMVPASLDAAETAETEAEAEAQAEAVAEAEAESLENAKRSFENKRLLENLDTSNLPDPLASYSMNLSPAIFVSEAKKNDSQYALWDPSVQATPYLRDILTSYTGNKLPPICLVLTKVEKEKVVVSAMTTSEASSEGMRYIDYHGAGNARSAYSTDAANPFSYKGTFVGILTSDGSEEGIEFVTHQKVSGQPDYTNILRAEHEFSGRMLLTYLTLGHTRFSKKNWEYMQEAYQKMTSEEKESLKKLVLARVGERNKEFLPQIHAKLFDFVPPVSRANRGPLRLQV